jgi:hypothetical protein
LRLSLPLCCSAGLSDDDLRETAYEVLLVSVGAAGYGCLSSFMLWSLQPPVRRLQVLKEKRLEGAKQVNQVVCLGAIWFRALYLSTEMLIMFQAKSFNGFLDFVVRLGFPGE